MLLVTLVSCQIPPVTQVEPGPERSGVREPGEPDEPKTIESRTRDLERHIGLLTLHVDEKKGTFLLELPAPVSRDGLCLEFLVNHGLRRGL